MNLGTISSAMDFYAEEYAELEPSPKKKESIKKESILVVTYPPDYDGELHITCKREENEGSKLKQDSFIFTRAHGLQTDKIPENSTPWQVLVACAKDILAEDKRRNKDILNDPLLVLALNSQGAKARPTK